MKKKLIVMAVALCLIISCIALAGCKNDEKGHTLDDGSIFYGKVEKGIPIGQGKLVTAFGDEFEGNFVEGLLKGNGTFLGTDGAEYAGEFAAGQFSGLGKLWYANGDYYSGEFVANIPEGAGRKEFVTGCIYEGGFVAGVMHGKGWMTWPGGDIYNGDWANGDPNGFGTKYFRRAGSTGIGTQDKYDIYMGEMSGGLLNGFGTMRYAFGSVYTGQWSNNARHGQGTLYFENNFEKDNDGKYLLPQLVFVGTFDKSTNYIKGEGTMYYRDGTVETGNWVGTELQA